MSSPSLPFITCSLAFLIASSVCASVIEHTFHVEVVPSQRLCKTQFVTTVNGTVPGPTIHAEEGDTLVVHVWNYSPYNITIHWHGLTQYMSCWYDGTESITQCPTTPSNKFTYKFNIVGQEGTFWWHAHSGFQRTTVYGAIVVYPRSGRSYPFSRPYKDVPIILGEWYNENVVELEQQLVLTGNGPNSSDAFTINGWPGDLYSCSSNRRRFLKGTRKLQNPVLELPSNTTTLGSDTFTLRVIPNETYLLRTINAAVNTNLFFKIANHNITVVAADGVYTNPYHTDLVVLAPGQTTDVLLTTDQPSGKYYMASLLYRTSKGIQINTIPGTGIIEYVDINGVNDETRPKMPILPDMFDTMAAFNFFGGLTGLATGPFYENVQQEVDENMFITLGLGLLHCEDMYDTTRCQAPLNQRIAGSLNNVSFLSPRRPSLLEAFVEKMEGIYTADFPDQPPVEFDYVNEKFRLDENLVFTERSTKVKQFKYNSSVEIVFQTHTLVALESHPIHIHGHNFYVLGQGFGNYNSSRDRVNLNFVDPHMRNTVSVPIGGWVIIRFRANNPGAWYIHCHNEGHVPIGLAGAFLVENGPTSSTMLPPPPDEFDFQMGPTMFLDLGLGPALDRTQHSPPETRLESSPWAP